MVHLCQGTMDAEFGVDFRREHPSTIKETRSRLEPDGALPALNGCFDCNICLDNAAEPVVTLCGHLYCWPCIYKWLRLESSTPQRCPVCKATLSQATLVPLYGRGYDSKAVDDTLDVPRRPSVTMTSSASDSETPRTAAQHAQQQQQQQHPHQHSHHRRQDGNYTMSSSSMTTARVLHPTMLGGVAIAVLPWVLGDQGMELYYPNPYPVVRGDTPRVRRQELQARRSLHRISIFLFCCVVLCLLVF